jgi:hypothetical protein
LHGYGTARQEGYTQLLALEYEPAEDVVVTLAIAFACAANPAKLAERGRIGAGHVLEWWPCN